MSGGGELRRSEAGEPDLRGTLSLLQHRLARAPLRPEAAAALAQALEALSRRLTDMEAVAEQRHIALERRLAEGEARLAERLDEALTVLAELEAAAEPTPLRLILGAAAMAGALSVLAAGAFIVAAHPQAAPGPISGTTAPHSPLPLRPGLRPAATATASRPQPGPAAPSTRTRADADSDASAVRALQGGDAADLPRLMALAKGGNADAALRLAGFYETGGAGVPRDLAAARAWTERAAAGGERVAMHNLALFLTNGEGGPRDDRLAARWFRRAADRGVVDSQFNLGLLYESGRGVERNLREAYRWFSIAANAGDLAARSKQLEVEARLAPGERAGLDQAAAAFQPGAAQPPDLAVVIPPATTLADTQALLARRGYYVGAIDGMTSPALRAATAAYLRDHPARVDAP
jgi:localization factor PodJL